MARTVEKFCPEQGAGCYKSKELDERGQVDWNHHKELAEGQTRDRGTKSPDTQEAHRTGDGAEQEQGERTET